MKLYQGTKREHIGLWLLGILCGVSIFLNAGCSQVTTLTAEDVQKIQQLSDIAQEWGPEGRISLRAGRPFAAGLFEGIIVVPGVEVDISAEAGATADGE